MKTKQLFESFRQYINEAEDIERLRQLAALGDAEAEEELHRQGARHASWLTPMRVFEELISYLKEREKEGSNYWKDYVHDLIYTVKHYAVFESSDDENSVTITFTTPMFLVAVYNDRERILVRVQITVFPDTTSFEGKGDVIVVINVKQLENDYIPTTLNMTENFNSYKKAFDALLYFLNYEDYGWYYDGED